MPETFECRCGATISEAEFLAQIHLVIVARGYRLCQCPRCAPAPRYVTQQEADMAMERACGVA